MRAHIFIGPGAEAGGSFRTIAAKKAFVLAKHGVLSPGFKHIRFCMACSDLDQPSLVQVQRGFGNAAAQAALHDEIALTLEREIEQTQPQHLVLASAHFGATLTRPAELERLKALLAPYTTDIRIHAVVEEQTRSLIQHYASAVMDGRATSLDQELALADSGDWWNAAIAARPTFEPLIGMFPDVQAAPHWLDYEALIAHFDAVFGAGATRLWPFDRETLMSDRAPEVLAQIIGLDAPLGKLEEETPPGYPNDVTLTRVRRFNDLLIRYMRKTEQHVPGDLWRTLVLELRQPGGPLTAGGLYPISDAFAAANARLSDGNPELAAALAPPPREELWTEADPLFGYRASQYLAAAQYRISKNARPLAEVEAERAAAEESGAKFEDIVPEPAAEDDSEAKEKFVRRVEANHQIVLSTHIRPHNKIGRVNEEELAAAYEPMPERNLAPGSSGNVIVGCMKNEAPYIVEWIAYHRAIGVDNFLIYTNACEDGTSEILDRLQAMGVIQHRNNDKWKGKSPQQYALNQSLKEPLIRNADWIIHIDVDEFINVRCGNGTLQDFIDRVPGATNIAMTWRLFGHNGVTKLEDRFVIEQFDTCAPKFCPKPHTVWGYKTMFRNIGAYEKISCHRPNKLVEEVAPRVRWVNGSGRDITRDNIKNGWRSSKGSIGYDLLQLNHYALRSAESFLIKRQRGRALHVDRSIGLNYWIRMDWSDFKDITIKRNTPRLQLEYDRLMQDAELKRLHEEGLAWHRAKAAELHGKPEFEELYQQAVSLKLTETERVAYALSLDLES